MRHGWTLLLFAAAMAYIESAVVVYLRDIFYPMGFRFPVVPIPWSIYLIESGRELGTLVLLYCVARISGRDRWERFLNFCFLFGIWDLFYYLWLKLFLNWPDTFLTWDILFLIPIPWVGPVLAPILVSLTLIGCSLVLTRLRAQGREIRFSRLSWNGILIAGGLVLLSFFWKFELVTKGGVPDRFPWWLFLTGWAGGWMVFLLSLRNLPAAVNPAAVDQTTPSASSQLER